ncbi:hypothetical protein R1sor_002635 [Riccia sorocarpa]|uniref:Uncharacterized protein n=1 Tax=Riccia sorocarpa TaxID=122646 RepID=A0ABD3GZQ7_9MARC
MPTLRNFVQLRNNLKAAWKQTLKRKWKGFVSEVGHSAVFRFGPEPKAPEPTILTVLIDALSLLDRRTDAGFWTEQLGPKVRQSARALKGIFPQVLPVESEGVRAFMQPLRASLIKSGLQHLEWLRAMLKFTNQFLVSEEEIIEKPEPEPADSVLPTPEKWIVHVCTSDDDAFRRRLSIIYVDEQGVVSPAEGLWPHEATDILVSQVLRDMRATLASYLPPLPASTEA